MRNKHNIEISCGDEILYITPAKWRHRPDNSFVIDPATVHFGVVDEISTTVFNDERTDTVVTLRDGTTLIIDECYRTRNIPYLDTGRADELRILRSLAEQGPWPDGGELFGTASDNAKRIQKVLIEQHETLKKIRAAFAS